MIDFEKYRKVIKDSKTSLSKDKVHLLLNTVQTELVEFEKNAGRVINVGKVYRPDTIEKHDVITSYVCGTIHPCIIYDVDETYVYAVSCTSTPSDHVVYKFEYSRIFKGKYLTNTIIRMTKQQALDSFVGIMDNIDEAAIAFAAVKELYKYLFKL